MGGQRTFPSRLVMIPDLLMVIRHQTDFTFMVCCALHCKFI